MTDKEFAKEQYEQLKRFAEYVWQKMPDSPERDAVIEEILIGMSEAKRRFNQMITENYKEVEAKVRAAAVRAGRAPEEVTLIAVSKTKPSRERPSLFS